MNDITGADIRCPKCKITSLYPQFVGNKMFLICSCGYGKSDYFQAVRDKEYEEVIKNKKSKTFFGQLFSLIS